LIFFENHGYEFLGKGGGGGGSKLLSSTTLNPKIKTHREPIFEVKIEADKLG
jgi:hypothetical protein